MQIGNSDLELVCKEAIVPAIKSCNLDPKRVDKHNEGRLLKTEIVKFIESSDIIVADLTNERPNCYLEVGYTMGIDKFRNLILTAREDHNQNSPKYKTGGPKIHFDLSGYDILFWDLNNLDDFKKELEKRIRYRMTISTPSFTPPVSPWDEQWISSHQMVAFEGLKRCSVTKTADKTGFMEIRMTLPNLNLNIVQRELLRAANQAQIHTFGWPIGVAPNSRDEYRPKPRTDGIVAEIENKDTNQYDYWSLRKNGMFYLLKSLFEDMRKPCCIFFDTRIVRITEALLYSVRLYSGLNVPPNSRILIGIRHGGLRERHLGVVGRRILSDNYKSEENEVYTEIETTFEKIEANLVDYVQEFTQPLFAIFDFFQLDRKKIKKIVTNFVAGKIT